MFRNGAFVVGSLGSNTLFLNDVSAFENSLPLTVRVIHAPPLGAGSRNDFAWQDNTVVDVTRLGKGKDHSGSITLSDGLTIPAGPDPNFPSEVYLGDFVGVVSARGGYAPEDYFPEVSLRYVESLFEQAGVEYVRGPNQVTGPNAFVSDIPRLNPSSPDTTPKETAIVRLLLRWAQNTHRQKGNWDPGPNHKIVCGAEENTLTGSTRFGVNNQLTSLTWVFNNTIRDYVEAHRTMRKQPATVVDAAVSVMQAETAAHEFTHHFRTNPWTNYHCSGSDKVMEHHPALFCIMNTSSVFSTNATQTQKWDGINGWHKSTPSTVGEEETIRKTPEPIPQGIDPIFFK